jgi:hypothetical protein
MYNAPGRRSSNRSLPAPAARDRNEVDNSLEGMATKQPDGPRRLNDAARWLPGGSASRGAASRGAATI